MTLLGEISSWTDEQLVDELVNASFARVAGAVEDSRRLSGQLVISDDQIQKNRSRDAERNRRLQNTRDEVLRRLKDRPAASVSTT